MSLKNNEKQTRLLTDNVVIETKRLFNLMLVVTFLLQLILPVMISVDASTNDDAIEPKAVEVQAQEENSDADIESPKTLSVAEEPTEEVEEVEESETPSAPAPEVKEEPGDNVVDEPVNKPEGNTKEEPNAPPASETPVAPEAKPEPTPEPEGEVKELEVVEEGLAKEAQLNVGILQSDITVVNYFTAEGTSTNGHYQAVGVYIDNNNDVHILINELSGGQQYRWEDDTRNNLNGEPFKKSLDGGSNPATKTNPKTLGTTATIKLADGSTAAILTSSNNIWDFNIGQMVDYLQETNNLFISNQAGGYNIGITQLGIRFGQTIIKKVNNHDSVNATIGDEVNYKVTVKNDGDLGLSRLVVKDVIPQGTTVTGVSEDGTNYTAPVFNAAGELILSSNLSLASKASKTYHIKAYVNNEIVYSNNQKLVNTAELGGSVPKIIDTAEVVVKVSSATIKKIITGDDANLQDSFEFKYSISRPGSNHYYASIVNQTFTLGHNDVKTFNSLPTDAVLTLSEDARNYEVTVTKDGQSESENPTENGEYEFSLVGLTTLSILVNNDLTIPKQDLIARKVWEGGPEENKNPVQLKLWRLTRTTDLVEVSSTPAVVPSTGPANEFTYTWSNMPSRSNNGEAYTYYFTEEIQNGYTRTYSHPMTITGKEYGGFGEHGGTVTNRYVIPSEGSASATKVWEGGTTAEYYAVNLKLWRTINGVDFTEVESPALDVTPNSEGAISYQYEWSSLEETDFHGNPYTYYFTEEDAPEGYERIYSSAIDVNDKKYGNTNSTVTNRKMIIDFSFTKVDEMGNPLTGATFQLEKMIEGSSNVEVLNTGTDPVFLYEDLTVGTYTLTETSAPDGYYLPTNASWTFDVVWNEETNQLEIVFNPGDEMDVDDELGYVIANYRKGMLPETGGPGDSLYTLVGLLSLMSLGIIYVWRKKRDEVNQND